MTSTNGTKRTVGVYNATEKTILALVRKPEFLARVMIW